MKIKGYECEIEGVFDDMYAVKITAPCDLIVFLEILRDRPSEKYLEYIIEKIKKT